LVETLLISKKNNMGDDGKFMQLWKKYMPVIKLLLKKSGDQKLQLYKHEFEITGSRNKTGYSFTIEITNGKVTNRISAIPIARDLVQAMNETPGLNEWLKTQSLKITMGRNNEIHFIKPATATNDNPDSGVAQNGSPEKEEENQPQREGAEA
jgi:hypothetical protein